MLKAAVIGVGNMGRNQARVYDELPGVELAAVADTDEETARNVARLRHVRAYTDYHELLDEVRPDVVSVTVPTRWHYQVAMDALEAGCHVLVEKPIAATLDEVQEIIARAAKLGRVLTVGHIERFNPAVIEMKRRIDAGQLGQIFIIHARRQSPFPKRILDVGVASDLATHELDMMRYLTGTEVAHLSAEVSQVLHPTHEDIVFGLLRFENGVLGILDVNWVTPTKIREISVTGERGMFVVNYLSQELFFHTNSAAPDSYDGDKWVLGHDFSVDEGDMIRLRIAKREPLRNELEAFVQAVQTGQRPVVSGYDGLQALKLARQIVESGRVARVES